MKSEERFKQLLRELFQSERADLDFGIYRVMNQKREALEEFIENGIVGRVEAALKDATTGAAGEADKVDKNRQEAIASLKKNINEESFDENGELKPEAIKHSPFAMAWHLLQGNSFYMPPPTEEMRKDVYNNLYKFFARYYDDGDFMCKQRYSANGHYAVPYNGEETLLHWANKDQYYIKTAEYFLRYEFKLPSGKIARFEMREAELERDNNESNAKKYFIPLTKEFSGDKNGCMLPFVYRPLSKEEKEQYGNGKGAQEIIIAAAGEALKSNAAAAPLFVLPLQNGESKPQKNGDEHKTLLSLHIEKYVKLNTADFFIHKNLDKFLRGELDYYINKELFSTEEQLRNNANSRARAAVAQATKAAGEVVIDFLVQLENYQKAIWEKKKFVVGTDYIITLQEIADKALRDIIAKNDAQWQEWKELNFIPADIPAKGKARLDFMESSPTLPVDTKHFDAQFKRQWLATVDGLEGKTDGVLFHGENWQALNLLQEKYRGKIKCVYIDPPYNTGQSEILYKNDYKHSSWLALMENRLSISDSLLSDSGITVIAIDHCELLHLGELADSVYGRDNRLGIITVVNKEGGRNLAKGISETNDYMLVYKHNDGKVKNAVTDSEILEEYDREDEKGKYKTKEFIRDFDPSSTRITNPERWYPIYVSQDLSQITVEKHEGYHEIFPISNTKREMVWGTQVGTFMRLLREGEILAEKEGKKVVIFRKVRMSQTIKTHWVGEKYDSVAHGTKLLKKIMGSKLFSYPKALYTVLDALKLTTDDDDIVLDYFAGSGTTAHAVINLNREDCGRRKFILVEMGEYFQTVIVPRVKKIIFTPEWKDGKPTRVATVEETKCAPRIVKYHRTESYEDALENIRFDEAASKPALLYDDYAPRYMLQAESGKSATFAGDCKAFQKPFNYTLQKYNAGKEPVAVADLPETFTYLIGLQEKTRQFVANGKTEYVVQRGKMEGKETVVLWRNTENWKEADYQREVNFVEEQGLTANAEQIFINDESRIKGAASLTPIFAAKMFPRNEE